MSRRHPYSPDTHGSVRRALDAARADRAALGDDPPPRRGCWPLLVALAPGLIAAAGLAAGAAFGGWSS